MLTFIVPVRDQRGVDDWAPIKTYLDRTLASLNGQTSSAFEVVVVANRGAEIGDPGVKGRLVTVDFDYIRLPSKGHADYLSLVRYDKGRRVMAGLVAAQPKGHIMVVDFDDLVSHRLAGISERRSDASGWYVRSGLLFDPTHRVLTLPNRFNTYCGTSLIMKADKLRIPARLDQAETGYFMSMFGSHRQARTHFASLGAPLRALPFEGAMYRIGHAEATSRSGHLESWVDKYFPERSEIRDQLIASIRPAGPEESTAFSAPWLAEASALGAESASQPVQSV